MKKKNGFTLIELLAVIIILGVLMIIAIPAVTKYINDSRKSGYINTAKEIVAGARLMVYSNNLKMLDTDTTYYIPYDYIKTEKANKSPYGEFTEAYVGVIFNGNDYKYYWISSDEAGNGVKNLTLSDYLDIDDIESDITATDITNTVNNTGIGNRNKILMLNTSTEQWEQVTNNAAVKMSEEMVCKKATTLHEVICKNDSGENGCSVDIGYNNKIVYGTIPSGKPKSGDAYDCKVRKDGGYTERFYYVTGDDNYAVLIYSSCVDEQERYSYDSTGENWHGPRDAYLVLPSTSEWDNLYGIIPPGTREIKNELNTNTTGDGINTLESFTYTNRAARFLTYQEIKEACGTGDEIEDGYLNNCNFLLENVLRYENIRTGVYGFYLENPESTYIDTVWYVSGTGRRLKSQHADAISYAGAKAAIVVSNTALEK